MPCWRALHGRRRASLRIAVFGALLGCVAPFRADRLPTWIKTVQRADPVEETSDTISASDILSDEALKKRQARLKNGRTETLYHSTSLESCQGILKTGFKPGLVGEMGPAIYFAVTIPEEVAQLKTSKTGCLIISRVRIGKVSEAPLPGGYTCLLYATPRSFQSRVPKRLVEQGFDTGWSARGCKTSEPEYAVYFAEQIMDAVAYKFEDFKTGPLIGRTTFGNGGIGAPPSKKRQPVRHKSERRARVGKGGERAIRDSGTKNKPMRQKGRSRPPHAMAQSPSRQGKSPKVPRPEPAPSARSQGGQRRS